MTDEMIMLNDVRFRVYMSIKSHLWLMFDEGILSLSSLEILTEVRSAQQACDKSVKDYKNRNIFWQYVENSMPSIEYLQSLQRSTRCFGGLGRNHLVGRLTQVFEVLPAQPGHLGDREDRGVREERQAPAEHHGQHAGPHDGGNREHAQAGDCGLSRRPATWAGSRSSSRTTSSPSGPSEPRWKSSSSSTTASRRTRNSEDSNPTYARLTQEYQKELSQVIKALNNLENVSLAPQENSMSFFLENNIFFDKLAADQKKKLPYILVYSSLTQRKAAGGKPRGIRRRRPLRRRVLRQVGHHQGVRAALRVEQDCGRHAGAALAGPADERPDQQV